MTETMEELEVIPATRSPHGYLASQLSDNIYEKDDGTLIVIGCPIARTGWQKYAVKDLPQERAKALGVDVSNPEASIELYRPAREVFHPEFLASLNGCTITDGHPPGGEFVDTKNFNKYSQGHIQNVRKGTEAMEDGEWPIIADLHISAEPLISKVRNKTAREISLGYDFGIDREGEKIIQCSMLGNHNAVVPKGRAGDLIRIEDAMPAEEASVAEPVAIKVGEPDQPSLPAEVNSAAPVVEVIEAIAYPPITFSFTNKEKHPVAEKKQQSWLRSLMGKHLIEKARAADADPEKIMDEVEAMHEEPTSDKKGRDEVEVPANTGKNEFKSADAKKGKDAEVCPDCEEPMDDCSCAMDAKAKDRKAAHDALDAVLDRTTGIESGVPAKDRKKAKDSNVAALKTLLDEFLSEEEKEPEHAADDAELDKVLAGGEDAEVCPDCEEPMDDCSCAMDEEVEVESGEEELEDAEPDESDPDDDEDQEPKGEDRKKAKDRARAADGAMAVLRVMRPYAARSGDKAFKASFNRALDSVKKSSKASTGSYGAFAATARARDRAGKDPKPDRARTGDGSASPDRISNMQKFYDTAHKGGK
jgi:hypothetical protein